MGEVSRRSFILGLGCGTALGLGGAHVMLLQAIPYPSALAPPTINANYAYARNLDTGQVYYSKGATSQIVPASLMKMATSLVVVQEKGGALSDTATVSASDLSSTTTFTQADLQENDVVSFENLLYCIMLPSGSEAAQTAGRAVGDLLAPSGGLTAFVSEMNTLASSLGMNNTVLTNTYGNNDSGAQYTTALDMWLLLREYMNDATLATIADASVRTFDITGPNARNHQVSAIHPIIEDEGVTGTKTGTYLGLSGDPAIYNLATTWVAPNGERVGIITAHSDSAADRQADQRAIIAQLPVDYPDLAAEATNGAGSVLLENEIDTVLLEDGTSELLLEG